MIRHHIIPKNGGDLDIHELDPIPIDEYPLDRSKIPDSAFTRPIIKFAHTLQPGTPHKFTVRIEHKTAQALGHNTLREICVRQVWAATS